VRRNYQDVAYKQWRKDVRKRDRSTCQMPGCKSRKRIQAHHIRKWSSSPSLRFEVTNGICLCYYCHEEVNRCEEQYVALFMEIVSGKNG